MFYIVGLGNPGEEYDGTRHNTGRIVLEAVRKKFDLPEWEKIGKLNALVSEGKIGKEKFMLIEPETFMNKSGASVAPVVTSAKKAESLILIHDDLDLPIGKIKLSFNRGSGGHKGVESVKKAVKTEAFMRLRVGICPCSATSSAKATEVKNATQGKPAKLKKPHGETEVTDLILGKFKPAEMEALKKVSKKACEAIEALANDGREIATMVANSQ